MATTTTSVGAPTRSGELLSERIAPGILPKVLGPFDMVAIFVAIVLFAVQGSVVQQAGASAFVYWILGFLTFLIPGAIVTGQLGLMFPGEGSIYVWTNKALGNFWGFFAGFCAWGPARWSWSPPPTWSSPCSSSCSPCRPSASSIRSPASGSRESSS